MNVFKKWNILGLFQPPRNTLFAGILLVVSIGYQHIPGVTARGRHNGGNDDGKPWFSKTEQNITVHPGSRAVLRCRVENLGTKTVTWRKQGDITPLTIGFFTFTPDTRFSLDYNQRTREWSLAIQAVKPEDEGWYYCQVTSKQDIENYYSIKLNVLSRPVYDTWSAVQVTGRDYVERGNQVLLMCNATGKPDPPHNVDWYKNGEKIESDAESGIIITKKIETKVLVSMLVIKQSEISDGGDYTCRSSNKDHATRTVHILNVVGSPAVKRGTDAGRKNASPATFNTRSPMHLVLVVCLLAFWLFDIRWQQFL